MDEYDDGPYWAILLMYGSHDMRHTGLRRLTVVNRTLGFWGITKNVWGGTHKKPPFLKPVWKTLLHLFTPVKKPRMRTWPNTKSIVPSSILIIKIKGLRIKVLRKSFMGKRILIPILFI